MAISKERKEELRVQYETWLNESEAVILAEYSGIPVKQLQVLRAKVRQSDDAFSITKNRLMRIALTNSSKPVPEDMLKGQLASGFALGDAPTLAKTLVDFAKDEETFVIRGAIMGDEVLTAAQVEALAKLPSLDQLRAQLLGLINAPARNIAGTVAAGIRQVVNVLDAYAKSDETEAAAA